MFFNEIHMAEGTNAIVQAGEGIASTIAASGTIFFVIMIMVLALMLAFGAISPQKRQTAWGGLVVCSVAFIIFLLAWAFPGLIGDLVPDNLKQPQ